MYSFTRSEIQIFNFTPGLYISHQRSSEVAPPTFTCTALFLQKYGAKSIDTSSFRNENFLRGADRLWAHAGEKIYSCAIDLIHYLQRFYLWYIYMCAGSYTHRSAYRTNDYWRSWLDDENKIFFFWFNICISLFLHDQWRKLFFDPNPLYCSQHSGYAPLWCLGIIFLFWGISTGRTEAFFALDFYRVHDTHTRRYFLSLLQHIFIGWNHSRGKTAAVAGKARRKTTLSKCAPVLTSIICINGSVLLGWVELLAARASIYILLLYYYYACFKYVLYINVEAPIAIAQSSNGWWFQFLWY